MDRAWMGEGLGSCGDGDLRDLTGPEMETAGWGRRLPVGKTSKGLGPGTHLLGLLLPTLSNPILARCQWLA